MRSVPRPRPRSVGSPIQAPLDSLLDLVRTEGADKRTTARQRKETTMYATPQKRIEVAYSRMLEESELEGDRRVDTERASRHGKQRRDADILVPKDTAQRMEQVEEPEREEAPVDLRQSHVHVREHDAEANGLAVHFRETDQLGDDRGLELRGHVVDLRVGHLRVERKRDRAVGVVLGVGKHPPLEADRKSTRLNSSH